MTAAAPTSAQSFLARFDGLKSRLPGEASVREAAAGALRARGLPGPKEEAWRYTSLRPLAEAEFHEPLVALDDCAGLLARLPALDCPRLIFVDGHYRADLSTPPPWFTAFADQPRFGDLARPEQDRLVALNTMLAEDGASLAVPADTDAGTVLLASLATDAAGRPVAFHPRHAVRLGARARLTLVEVSLGDGRYLHNPVTGIEVGEGAALTHVRLQDESPRALHLATLYATIAAGGAYDSFLLTLGARLARAEVHATLAGPGASVHLNAGQLLDGNRHGDFTTVVRHAAPGCASRQTVKNVLDGHSRGVFQGRIEVARHAQKTDGYQMNQALLLSEHAEIDVKPELEIFADDVKCSHGATVGALDPDQIFYLRSRGIPPAAARMMLVRAFLAEALDAVGHDAARAMLEDAVQHWWERQGA